MRSPIPSLATRRSVALALVLAAPVVSGTGAAAPSAPVRALQPLESIEARAADALRERAATAAGVDAADGTSVASVEVVPLDRRLRLDACAVPLAAAALDAPGGAPWGAATVEVACPDAPAWRVRVRARVVVARAAWVLRRAVRRDEPLDAALVARETVRLGAIDGPARRRRAGTGGATPVVDLDARLGERFVHPLPAGAVLDASDLAPALLVRRGSEVRLLREGGGLSVEARAVALADGRDGERVAVRNERSGRRVEAVVTGPDEVVVR